MKLTARKRRVAMVAAGALVAGGMVGVPVGMAYAATSCDVVYTTNDWSTGFTANVTIKNLGDPLTNWRLGFAFPGNQRITQGWSATWTQSGSNVTATNMPWNGNVATGGQLTIGFNASYSGTNGKPTAFTINGVACNGAVNQAPTVTLTSPTATSFTAPADVTVAADAADLDGSISKVEFFRNGLLVNEDTQAPYSYLMSALPAGEYTVQARAYDNGSPALTGMDEHTFTVTGTSTRSVVTPPTVTIAEGSSSSLNVKLSAAPTANVAVGLTKTGDADITLGATSVTITPNNWNTGVNVPVNAAQDADGTDDTGSITASAPNHTPSVTQVTVQDDENTEPPRPYAAEFMELYNKIKAPASGYFSPEGVPYHSVETLLAEAPDHGHETTSEAFSYWLFLEAMYGRSTGNWGPFNNAWTVMDRYAIPANTQGGYNPNDPADYAPEAVRPDLYPQQGGKLDSTVPVGQDPLYSELTSTYGSNRMYSMHWLLDVDNVYGFGNCGNGTSKPAYINTYQRGPQESVFETIPHPSCETFNFGRTGNGGFLPIFIGDSTYTQQWRYTSAPDADARAVQAAYWALKWAKEQGNQAQIATTVQNAAKMGDHLRYAMYDKYYKQPGCASPSCPAGTGKNSSAYLLSWYSAWGGPQGSSSWAWRIGSSHNHGGYQNPFAAWALSSVTELIPRSPTAKSDWEISLDRQLDFYTWLQSAEGAIAGGATNSWNGDYSARPSGVPTFYGMTYDVKPVYHDPPSNQWFGFQAWTMERVAELYYETGNAQAKALLDKWVTWAIANTTVNGSTYQVPSTLSWTGQPGGNWTSTTTSVNNSGLRVSVVDHTTDVGVTGAFARTLIYYGAKANHAQSKATAKALLDALLTHKDAKGIAVTETKADYNRFDDPYNASTGQGVYVPPGYTGVMPNGDPINSNSTFLSIRSFLQRDAEWGKVQSYLAGGPVPTFTYHRFWAQIDVAMALHDYDLLIGS
jgi:hypothetical protein